MSPTEKERKFKSCYEDWAQPLFRFIYFKSRDKDLAEDIVQDTFVKFWDKMDTVSKDKEKSYLFATARNLYINNVSHQKVVLKHQEAQTKTNPVSSPHFELEVAEFRQKLEKAIAALPDGQREVFLLHRIDGYKYKEIAELLEVSQKAVEKRMSQALKSLRKICTKI